MDRIQRGGLASALVAMIASAAIAGEAGLGAESRRGSVHLQGRALADEEGPFNALGASLFWALWGERHDPARLDANLEWLARHGVDFVRILGMVGTESWSDRRIDPREPDYWTFVDRLLTRLDRHQLRAELTIFADAQVMMPDPEERRRFADRWAERVDRDRDRFIFVEISNEYWQNGFEDVAELRALGRRVADRTPVLVALSAADAALTCDVYAGSAADLATVHYPRNVNDRWQAVLQPWRWPADYDASCEGKLPAAVNNEPAGPGASGHDEPDPRRLVMAYLVSFLSQNAAYVVHTDAGVRGGGRFGASGNRRANVFDVPGLNVALAGMRAAGQYLPEGIANWDRKHPADAAHPFAGLDSALDEGLLAGAVSATSGGRFVVAIAGARAPIVVRARRACTVELRNLMAGDPLDVVDVGPGEEFSLEDSDAFVLTGVCR